MGGPGPDRDTHRTGTAPGDSIATGSVPQDWRIANVVPIFKKGSKSEPGNYRPIVPYVGTIFSNLEPGTMVVVYGVVAHNADRFQIDFQCGSSVKPRSDVAFHFNPRYKGSGVIVCNTLLNEKWGWEEKSYQMPFQKGQRFEVVFFVLPNKFQVAANRKHLLIYKHRVSLDKIDTLSISGMVEINTVGFANHTVNLVYFIFIIDAPRFTTNISCTFFDEFHSGITGEHGCCKYSLLYFFHFTEKNTLGHG
ncbi:unnamed protein product [Ranitomeya imitator]|uniref:Galectin n=1 Tax=Ranitomeya imitator TaxID=111125 RepID=A0ABN9L1L0_9NEOB|nr:unnamed protein product [Ranitomeya imitator]